jgi:purine-binding chemotaxis protein CheW
MTELYDDDNGGSMPYLIFTLADEDFAIDIHRVREIVDYTTITKVPRMPDFLKGMINLRGDAVPVTDLRVSLGMPPVQKTVDTCIIIVEIHMEKELTLTGIIADSVKEVSELDPSQIAPPPKIGTKLKTDFIRGIGKKEEKFLILLDIDKVFSEDELFVVQQADEAAKGILKETEGPLENSENLNKGAEE